MHLGLNITQNCNDILVWKLGVELGLSKAPLFAARPRFRVSRVSRFSRGLEESPCRYKGVCSVVFVRRACQKKGTCLLKNILRCLLKSESQRKHVLGVLCVLCAMHCVRDVNHRVLRAWS